MTRLDRAEIRSIAWRHHVHGPVKPINPERSILARIGEWMGRAVRHLIKSQEH